MVSARHEQGPEHLAVGGNTAYGKPPETDPVIASFAANHAKPRGLAFHAVIAQGHLKSGIHSLGARVHEKDFAHACRCHVHDALGEL